MGSMFRETSLGSAISLTSYQEQRDHYDRICKRILSEKILLGWILHECLREYQDVSPEDIAEHLIEGMPAVSHVTVHRDEAPPERITGGDSEDSSVTEGTVWFDIRFEALLPDAPASVGVIVNIEAQGNFFPGYPLLKRAMYNCARMLSSQYGRIFADSHYERLQKVFSIWICPEPPHEFRNTITRYALAESSVVGTAHAQPSEYDLLEVLLVCPDGDRQSPGDGILRLLGMLIGSSQSPDVRKAVIRDEFGIPLSKELSDEVDEMSDVSRGIFDHGIDLGYERGQRDGYKEDHDRGYDEGRERGYDEGHERGYGEGYDVASLANIRSLMRSQGLTADEAMSALDVAVQDRPRFRDLL